MMGALTTITAVSCPTSPNGRVARMTTPTKTLLKIELESDVSAQVCVLRRNWAPDERSCHSDPATERQKERRDRQSDRVQSELVGHEQPSNDDRRRPGPGLAPRFPLPSAGQHPTRRADRCHERSVVVRYVCPTALPCEFRRGSLHRTIFQARENRVPERLVLNLATWLEPLRLRLTRRCQSCERDTGCPSAPRISAHAARSSCSSRDRERSSVTNADARVARSLNSSGFSR